MIRKIDEVKFGDLVRLPDGSVGFVSGYIAVTDGEGKPSSRRQVHLPFGLSVDGKGFAEVGVHPDCEVVVIRQAILNDPSSKR